MKSFVGRNIPLMKGVKFFDNIVCNCIRIYVGMLKKYRQIKFILERWKNISICEGKPMLLKWMVRKTIDMCLCNKSIFEFFKK
jgi:hypothetical protein